MKINVLIFNVPKPETNLKEVRVRIDMAFVGGSCNEECIMNLDLKYEIKKLSGWENIHTGIQVTLKIAQSYRGSNEIN